MLSNVTHCTRHVMANTRPHQLHEMIFERTHMCFSSQFVNVAKRAHDQCSILVQFNNFGQTTGFFWSYMLLL